MDESFANYSNVGKLKIIIKPVVAMQLLLLHEIEDRFDKGNYKPVN